MSLLPEIAIILLLVLVNGVLAMSEIAVVSSRKAVLKARAEAGSKNAGIALSLAENPDRFLSTVQVGITLVGIVAGAYGGVAISDSLALFLARIAFLKAASEEIALVAVVCSITFLSILVGELVPKRVALRSPETVAAIVARPMLLLSKVAAPSGSSRAVPTPFCGSFPSTTRRKPRRPRRKSHPSWPRARARASSTRASATWWRAFCVWTNAP